MQKWYYIIVFILIVIGVSFYIFFLIRRNKYINYLYKNSAALKRLHEINEKYSFSNKTNKHIETHTYDNEIFYDNISCEDYLIYILQFQKYDIDREIRVIYGNRKNYELYCNEVNNINCFGDYITKDEKLDKDYLEKLEKELFEQEMQRPALKFEMIIKLYCSKINGEVYNSKKQKFDIEEVSRIIKRLNNKTGNFYNDKGIWDSICRVERGKVSNKMRFSIYSRDKYRCRICGRTERQDYLEIDHIIPIAKGGKSTYDNLQTLCRRCNKNKGDKLL